MRFLFLFATLFKVSAVSNHIKITHPLNNNGPVFYKPHIAFTSRIFFTDNAITDQKDLAPAMAKFTEKVYLKVGQHAIIIHDYNLPFVILFLQSLDRLPCIYYGRTTPCRM